MAEKNRFVFESAQVANKKAIERNKEQIEFADGRLKAVRD
jgi:hypothetical protein